MRARTASRRVAASSRCRGCVEPAMGLLEMLRRRDQAEPTVPPPGLGGRLLPVSAAANLDRVADGGGLPVSPDVLAHFHQLPSYQALLTVGPDAVYQLPALLGERLVALDCGARQARLVRATMSAADRLALESTAKAVKGALRARGYGVLGELVAEPHVLKEILRNAGASGKPGARGGPMQLFERWVASAVPTGATDLHIEVRRNTALVRIRVDGRMEPLPDGQGGRYSRKEAIDAIAAGYNSTRKGNNVSQYLRHLGEFTSWSLRVHNVQFYRRVVTGVGVEPGHGFRHVTEQGLRVHAT